MEGADGDGDPCGDEAGVVDDCEHGDDSESGVQGPGRSGGDAGTTGNVNDHHVRLNGRCSRAVRMVMARAMTVHRARSRASRTVHQRHDSSAWAVEASTTVGAFEARRFTAVIDCPTGPSTIHKVGTMPAARPCVLREPVPDQCDHDQGRDEAEAEEAVAGPQQCLPRLPAGAYGSRSAPVEADTSAGRSASANRQTRNRGCSRDGVNARYGTGPP